MCWRRRRRWDVRRSTWRAPWSATPQLLSRKPRSERANGLQACRNHAHRSRSEEHTSELQSQSNLVCRLLLEKKKKNPSRPATNRTTTTKKISYTSTHNIRALLPTPSVEQLNHDSGSPHTRIRSRSVRSCSRN